MMRVRIGAVVAALVFANVVAAEHLPTFPLEYAVERADLIVIGRRFDGKETTRKSSSKRSCSAPSQRPATASWFVV